MSRLLKSGEREAVLGDIVESGASAGKALFDLLSLVARRQALLWDCGQSTEGVPVSIAEIYRRAEKFEEKIYWRNAREYAAGITVAAFCGVGFLLSSDALMRASLGLIIGGMAYMMWHLHRRGSWRRLPDDFGLVSGTEFYRRELTRQRDLLRGVWWWYLGPITLPLVIYFVALARTSPSHGGRMGFRLALFGIVLVLVWWLNHRGARKLQARIDELDAPEKPR